MRCRPLPLALAGAALLAGCSPGSGTPPAARTGPDGERLYAGNCIACHQPAGQGIPGVYPPLSGSAVVLGDPSGLAAWIARGRRPPGMPTGRYPTAMPQFNWLGAADAAALITYLRTSFGNHAGPVDASAIAAALP